MDEIGAALSVALHAGRRLAPPQPAPVVVPEEETPIRLLRLSDFQAEPLFPTLSKYYDRNAFGSVSVTNSNPFPVEDVQVRFFMNTYMDSPKRSVGGRVSLRYVAQDQDREHEETFTLTVLDRNALVWEDDRRAAGGRPGGSAGEQ